MSSLLALQTKDTIVFASDTALSAKINNTTYRVDNNESKLFNYEDFVMFASGRKSIRDLFISNLSNAPSLFEIQEVLQNIILPISEEYSLEIVIAMKDLSKLVFLSSTNNYEYSENCSTENINLFTAGFKTEEVANKFENYYGENQLIKAIELTYKDISCTEIGGNLDIIILEKSKVRLHTVKIDNMKTYSDEELIKLSQLVFANKLHGRLILSNKLWVEDDLGVVEIKSGLMTVYDNNGNPRVYLGRYPTFNNPNQFAYGLRVIDGAFDIRTSNDTNKGVVITGDGISAFNNNGVRTFNVDAATGKVSIVGSLDIRTSADTNKGVVIDGDGIKIYNASGTIMFSANASGDVFYKGRLDGATGTVSNLGGSLNNMTGNVNNLTGSINAMDGTFKGSLTAATGTFNGIVTGSLSADTVSAIRLDVDQLVANNAQITSLSAISADLGTVTAGNLTGVNINTTQDMTIGNNLYIGTHFANQNKAIIFGGGLGGARIDYMSDSLYYSAMNGHYFSGGAVVIHGTLDLTNATVIGL